MSLANRRIEIVNLDDLNEPVSVTQRGSTYTLAVEVVDASGNQITNFAAGTEYTEGDTDSTIQGTAMMWEDAGDTLRAISASKPLPVDLTTDSLAGNLDVNLAADGVGLAQESGGNLATLAGAVSGSEMQVDVVSMPTTTVDATDLDIRDLSESQDAITIYGSDDGGTTKRIIKTDSGGAIQVDLEVAEVTITDINTGGTQSNDLKVTLDGETVTLAANDGTDIGDVDVQSLPSIETTDLDLGAGTITKESRGIILGGFGTTTVLADDGAYGDDMSSGLVAAAIRGYDSSNSDYDRIRGTVANGLEVDVTRVQGTVTVDATGQGDVPITLDSEAVTLAANDGTDIGDVDVASIAAGTNIIGKTYLTDGTEDVAVNASNELQVRDDDANTDLDTLAGAVSGSEMQVDVVAALPAGDNNIGNVDIASSVALDVSAATVAVDATGQGDVPITLDGETVDTELTTGDLDTGAGTDTRAVVGLVSAESGGGTLVGSADPLPVDIAADTAGGLEVVQDTAADLNVTEANSGDILTALQIIDDWDNGDTANVTISADSSGGVEVVQDTHDDLNANVTLQVGDTDVDSSNPVPTEHSITGIGDGVKTVTTAGTDEALAGSTACKRVVIQALLGNTGNIAVGASGVDATATTGTGIILEAGDVFELEIDNLADIYIDSTQNGEGVRYCYFT